MSGISPGICSPTEPALPQHTEVTNTKVTVDLVAASYRSETFPKSWTREQRERGATRYEKWLQLKREALSMPLAPTAEIDLFWHLHMLAPVAYVSDCERLFGFILDHDGGFGRDERELPQLMDVFLSTARRWEARYGEAYADDGSSAEQVAKCWHYCNNYCWHACSEKVDAN